MDSEIEKLVDSLTGANNVLLSYVNVKIAELDGRKQELLAKIAELTVEAIFSISLSTWASSTCRAVILGLAFAAFFLPVSVL
mgnify:CR=1 FL=1